MCLSILGGTMPRADSRLHKSVCTSWRRSPREAAYEALRAQAKEKAEIVIDRQLDVTELVHAERELQKLAPFGIGNEKPLFIFQSVSISKQKHLVKPTIILRLRSKAV
jgi:single-stranded DNA-specific DHH superfamily exonuclease